MNRSRNKEIKNIAGRTDEENKNIKSIDFEREKEEFAKRRELFEFL